MTTSNCVHGRTYNGPCEKCVVEHGAKREREAIVLWLKRRNSAYDCYIANRIENGEHLKEST